MSFSPRFLLLPLALAFSPAAAGAQTPPPAAAPVASFVSEAKGNVFAASEGKVVLRLEQPDLVAGGSIVVRDESGKSVQEAAVDPAKPETALLLPGKGFYALEATVRRRDGGSETVRTSAAVVGPALDPAVRMKSHLGLWTVSGDPDLLVLSGARWNRQMLSLRSVQPDLLKLAETDSANPGERPVPAAAAPQFTYVGVFSFGLPLWIYDPAPPPMKEFGNPFQAPKDWNLLKKLVKAYVLHPPSGQFPSYLEIYNEPEWHWKGSVEDLVKFNVVVAEAVKEARPDVQVLGPGMSTIRIHDGARIDLEKLAKLGLFDHLDGLVMHAYVDGTPPEGEFIQRVIDLKAYLAKIGKPDFPIHFTEFGWTTVAGTWQKPVDELTQAQYLSRSLVLLGTQGIENATYFCYVYKSKNAGEEGFQIAHHDLTPKPAFAAYANVARWLADADNHGRWLQITPSTNLAVFRKGSGVIGVAWDNLGKKPFALPSAWGRAEDFTGRPVAVPDSGIVTLSPSTLFVELKDDSLDKVAIGESLRLMRGNSETLPAPGGGKWIAPAPLSLDGNRLKAPADAPEGKYLLLSKGAQGWQGQPVEVVPPLRLTSVQMRWSADQPFPSLAADLESYAAADATSQLTAKFEKAPDLFSKSAVVKPGEKQALSIPLKGVVPGQRYSGKLLLESQLAGGRDHFAQPLDFTVVSAVRIDGAAEEPDWNSVPAFDFSGWDPFGGPLAAADCSATFQAAYGRLGLHFLIRVREAAHHQDAPPEKLWTEDSLQFGLDADADKSWEANDLFGLKGHRVFEYGIGWDGNAAANWRWISYLPELPANSAEPKIKTQARRDGDVTEYDITFPWETLGLKEMPEPGSAIGMALVVNKFDPQKQGQKQGLRLFHGVSESKNPEEFGKLWLR